MADPASVKCVHFLLQQKSSDLTKLNFVKLKEIKNFVKKIKNVLLLCDKGGKMSKMTGFYYYGYQCCLMAWNVWMDHKDI